MQNYIKPNWPAPANIHAFTSTRVGGFSVAPYASFNLATHVGDAEKMVRQNRAKLIKDLALPAEPYWLKQTHSRKVVCVDDIASANYDIEADASYTTQPGKVCAVLTADCVPILVAAKDGSLVAAIHAGWQGLAIGVIEATLQTIFKRTGKDSTQFLVWLGPGIGPQAFVVGTEVREQFIAADSNAASAFVKQATDKWLGDLYAILRQRLQKLAITSPNIYGGEFCTYTDDKLFYSYRRDGATTGRMASIIVMD